MIEVAAIFIAVLLLALLVFLVYRSVRTYDAGSHATFITSKSGEYFGALRAPITLWDPTIRVLKDKSAPDISFITVDPSGNEYFEKSLVKRSSGEISLRVNVCAPRPFVSRTSEKKKLIIRPKVAFQLDIDRIQIPTQMQAFGAVLANRIENLFDNAIGEYEDQEVFAKQGEIEARVLRQLQDIEFPPDPTRPVGMPLGIKVYEAMFSYEPVEELEDNEGGGAMGYSRSRLDDLADMLEKADPRTIEVLMRMMELQTRQNIVKMLCESGGLVAFTAQELGLSERTVERASNGVNIMKPAAGPAASTNGGADTPAVAAEAVDPAMAYYNLGPPPRH